MEDERPRISAIEAEASRIEQSVVALHIGLDPFQRKEVALLIIDNIIRLNSANYTETLFYKRVKLFIASSSYV